MNRYLFLLLLLQSMKIFLSLPCFICLSIYSVVISTYLYSIVNNNKKYINYKLYFDRTVLTDIHIQHNRPDIIILNKQQKQAYLLDI
jgi:hypothetical protein